MSLTPVCSCKFGLDTEQDQLCNKSIQNRWSKSNIENEWGVRCRARKMAFWRKVTLQIIKHFLKIGLIRADTNSQHLPIIYLGKIKKIFNWSYFLTFTDVLYTVGYQHWAAVTPFHHFLTCKHVYSSAVNCRKQLGLVTNSIKTQD